MSEKVIAAKPRFAGELRDPRSRMQRMQAWARGEPRTPPAALVGPIEEPDLRRLGICCSGGGIRSAAYNLGALQVLSERGEFQRATYLTAVSGGSYIAAARSIVSTQTDNQDLFRNVGPYDKGSPEEQWLRDHCDYLAPGLLGKAQLLLRILAGLSTNFLIVGVFLYVVARPWGWLYQRFLLKGLPWRGPNPFETIRPWMWEVVAVPAGLAVALAWIDIVFRPRRDRVRRLLTVYALRLATVAAAVLVVLVALPYLVLLLRHGSDNLPSGLRSLLRSKQGNREIEVARARGAPPMMWPMLGALALGALRALWAKKRSFVALTAAMVVGPLTVLLVFVWFLNSAGGWARRSSLVLWGAMTVLFMVFYFVSDLTNWSGHPFYKRRLAEGYAVRRVSETQVEELPYDGLLRVSEAQPPDRAQLLVCAAANLSSRGSTPPGRNATSFVFNNEEVGGPLIGTVPTADFEQMLGPRARDATLLSAIAMSGAAISPSMGKLTIRPLRFLLGITGIRLGVWLPNPRWSGRWQAKGELSPIERPRLVYLVKELFGLDSVDDKFLYITDGGHFENLGLVELLRRGCTQIYCFDASGEKDDTFFTLAEAIAIAREDLQVQIDIDVSAMSPVVGEASSGHIGLCGDDHAVGKIRYGDGTSGILVYAKAAVTADAPYETQAYRQRDPQFPHHPTFDQLFDDEKFEAYWSLGRFTAGRAIDAMQEEREEDVPVPAILPRLPLPLAQRAAWWASAPRSVPAVPTGP